jgi:hypothetical protein
VIPEELKAENMLTIDTKHQQERKPFKKNYMYYLNKTAIYLNGQELASKEAN